MIDFINRLLNRLGLHLIDQDTHEFYTEACHAYYGCPEPEPDDH